MAGRVSGIGISTNVKSHTEDAIEPNGLSANVERPEEVEQAEQPEKEWDAMQMEDEEGPWAGLGMDETEETPPGILANVESLADIAVDPEEELNELGDERAGVDEDGEVGEELRQKFATRRRKAHRDHDRKKIGSATWLQQTPATEGGDPNRR